MVERLRASPWMPPALKERLAPLVGNSADADDDGAPRLKVADVVAAIVPPW